MTGTFRVTTTHTETYKNSPWHVQFTVSLWVIFPQLLPTRSFNSFSNVINSLSAQNNPSYFYPTTQLNTYGYDTLAAATTASGITVNNNQLNVNIVQGNGTIVPQPITQNIISTVSNVQSSVPINNSQPLTPTGLAGCSTSSGSSSASSSSANSTSTPKNTISKANRSSGGANNSQCKIK